LVPFVQDYFQQILLSGGTTMFPGMSSRLEKDIANLFTVMSLEVT
jgi:actin-related protein